MSLLRLGSLLAVAVLLSACVASNKPAVRTSAQQVSAGVKTAPLSVDQIIFDLRRGQSIGTTKGPLEGCMPTNSGETWEGGSRFSDEPEWIDEVETTLLSANFDVDRKTGGSLFEGGTPGSRAAFLLGGVVKDINLATCYERSIIDGSWTGVISSDGTMTMEWQLFSLLQQQVVFTVQVTAPATSGPGSKEGVYLAIVNGIGNAAAELTKDPAFVAALSLDGGASTAAMGTSETLAIKGAARLSGSFSSNAERTQAATVLIVGRGHGSGVMISSDGYLLTNYHVVGDANEVRVELGNAGALIGQVLRRDPRRDVALIKVPVDGATALPLNTSIPGVGSEIYAIGAPLDTTLTDTVTKGIVSSIRDRDGQRFIQGDLDIQPGNSGGPLTDPSGNVIGLTVSGIMTDGTSVGINFFIPIAEALAALNVTVN